VSLLREEFPDTWMQTHLSENPNEVAWVSDLWPEHERYLDVYHHYGLTGERSVFAHGIHLHHSEWQCLHDTGSAVAFCPTSNLFLGSGLFRLPACWQHKVRMGIGTDVGAGTTFSMLRTLGEAYKVGQLQSYRLQACEAFYHATLGARTPCGWTIRLAILRRAKRPTLSLSTRPLRRFSACATAAVKIFTSSCLY
jgi:guanine deaminase